jgi:hypothetical protein
LQEMSLIRRHASYEIVSVLKFEKNRFVEIH